MLWSSVLSDLRKLFSEIASSFNVTSACASLKSSKRSANGEVTPGDSGLTYLGHERVLHLDGVKHLTISKFPSQDDLNYLRLADRVRAGWTCITSDMDHISKVWSWIGLPTAGGGQPSSFDSMTWNTMDHETALQRRHPDTGGWLFQKETFQSWASRSPLRREDTRVLWLTGQGGAGKSVLCSYSIDTISKPLGSGNKTSEAPLSPATPYIYLRYGKERNKCQLAQLLAAQLLEHVLREQGGVEMEVLSLLKQNASEARNLRELIRLLVAQCSTVYFFLDGLNEIALADAAPSETRRIELDRLKEDLRSTVKFLADMTRDDTVHVRLWCSSQKSQPVITWMQDLGAKELKLDRALVTKDVLSYLAHVREETVKRLSDPEDKRVVATRLLAEAGTNFRWAYMMAESLRNCKQPKLLVQKVEQGLPRDLRTSYKSRLEELLMLDGQDVEDGNGPPLSMNILSVLACARRPLRLSELRGALSILEVPWEDKSKGACHNLEPDIMIQKEDMMHRCTPLVEFVPFDDTATSDGFMSLSHGSVFEFLHEKVPNEKPGHSKSSINDEKKPEPVVNKNLIAEACLKYLSQIRYSKLLRKRSPVDFWTTELPPTNIRQHHFLQYAAKYWYRHLEDAGPSPTRCADITTFLISPQFITVIQIQSLFIVGHFIHSFDQNKDNGPGAANHGRMMKRNLPEWFRTRNEGRELVAQYEIFFSEWSTFLQLGVTDFLNGEIERCLWGTLGKKNFLWEFGTKVERNKSYALVPASDPATPSGKECFLETICEDGRRVSVWRLKATSSDTQDNEKPSQPLVTLTRDMWYVDGKRDPFQYGTQEIITFDPTSVGWDLYDPCRLRTFPLIPTAGKFLARSPPVADCRHGLNVRVGGVEFFREKKPGGSWVPRSGAQKILDVQQQPSRLYWEDISMQGPYKVRSRRVLVEVESSKGSRPEIGSKGTTPGGRGFQSNEDGDFSDDSAEESDGVMRQEILSSADEYCTLGSDEWSDEDEEASDDAWLENGQASLNDQGEDNSGGESDRDSDGGSSFDQQQSSSSINNDATITDQTDPDIGDEADSEGDSDSASDSGSINYQPGIAWRGVTLECNLCEALVVDSDSDRRGQMVYQCTLCPSPGSYDICPDCFNAGNWCESKTHQLRRMVLRKGRLVTLEILSRDDARTGVSISVSRMTEGSMNKLEDDGRRPEDSLEEIVFRYTLKSTSRDSRASLMHTSPPVTHPTLPLLVYPLQGTKLLFANLENNTYMTHNISYDETERSQDQQRGNPVATVSVHLHFSLCGRYLHVARVTSAAPKHLLAGSRKSKMAPNTARLFLQTITVRLSRSNPCSGVPRTLTTRRGTALGTWRTPAVFMLPYRLTWADGHLYVCEANAASMLRVFKIPLSTTGEASKLAEQEQPTSANTEPNEEQKEEIMRLAEIVPLPRSARTRPVHFYPATDDDPGSCARVILGSTHGSGMGTEPTQPAAVVYLQGNSLEWVPAQEAAISSFEEMESGRLRIRKNDSLLEDFDADSDCDLIMPLLDFQR